MNFKILIDSVIPSTELEFVNYLVAKASVAETLEELYVEVQKYDDQIEHEWKSTLTKIVMSSDIGIMCVKYPMNSEERNLLTIIKSVS